MKVRQILIIVCTLILLIFMFMIYQMGYGSGLSFGEQNAEKIREKRKAAAESINDTIVYKSVKAKVISNDSVPAKILGYGRVVSTSAINVSTEVQGKITSAITLKKGIHFKQGQVLFSLNNQDAKLALKARKSGFLSLLASILPDIKIDFPDNFPSWNQFYNDIRVNEPIPLIPELKSAKEKNFIVARKVLTEYYNIKSDEERIRKYTITAPFNGSIIDAFADVGAIVNPGGPVLSIIRDNQMEIEIPISADKVGQVKIGSLVTLTDHNHKSYTGKIGRIGDYINQQTLTVPVFVEITGSTEGLYNGMYLDAHIHGNGFSNVVEIPRKALISSNKINTIAPDSTLTEMIIDVLDYQENTVTASGIPNGTVVVIESVVNISKGEKVITH